MVTRSAARSGMVVAMRALIVGAGEVGWYLAGRLAREQHEVVVLDRDRELLVRRSRSGLDVRVERADAISPRALAEHRAGEADLFVAVTASDATNLLACLLAKEQRPEDPPQTMARVRDADYYARGEDTAAGTLGIDLLVSPELAAVGDLESALRVRGAVRVETFAEDRLALAECIVTEGSPAARRSITTRPHATDSRIVALLRDGRVHLASKDTTPLPGDHLVVACPREQLKEACREIDPGAQQVHRVAIFGAGQIGVALAARLDIGLVLAVLSREEFAPLAEALGVDGTVAPRLAAAERLLRTSRGTGARKSTLLADGLEALEYRISAGSPLCQRPVVGAMPRETLLAAVVRDGEVRFPQQLDRFTGGDVLLVLATGNGAAKLGAVLGS